MLSMTWSRTWRTLLGLPIWRSFTNWSPKIDMDDKPWTSNSCTFWKARSTILLLLGNKSQTSSLIKCCSTQRLSIFWWRLFINPFLHLFWLLTSRSHIDYQLDWKPSPLWQEILGLNRCLSQAFGDIILLFWVRASNFFATSESLGSSTWFSMAELFSWVLLVFESSYSASSESVRRRMLSLKTGEHRRLRVVKTFEDHRHAVLWRLVYSTVRALKVTEHRVPNLV